jgi:protein ImuB
MLCERLQARLGDHQVLRIHLHDSHQPESASQLVALEAQAPRGTQSLTAPPPSALPPRPLWLLEAPVALPIRGNKPFYEGPLRLRAGPERIETDWWTSPLRRDYFVAETQDQRLLWVFRNPSHEWFLHGLFG